MSPRSSYGSDARSTPHFIASKQSPLAICDRRRSVLDQECGAVQINDLALLREYESRRSRKARADHRTRHDAQTQPPRLGRDQQAFGQPSALVELDVDDVEAAYRTT